MQIDLINGQFSSSETVDLLSQMVLVKIKFLENKICNSSQEEDIKSKESKIIALQNSLLKLREKAKTSDKSITLNCSLEINI